MKTTLAQRLLQELLDIAAALGELRANDRYAMDRIAQIEHQISQLLLRTPSAPADEPIETMVKARIKLAERAISMLPSIWQGILWIWHLVLWMLPGMLAGWGIVEAWWAVGWRFLRAIFP